MQEYLATVTNAAHRQTLTKIYEFLTSKYPQLAYAYKWNQPMFTHEGTFIIGFSYSSKYVNIAPERITMDKFMDRFAASGYRCTKSFWCIAAGQEIDFDLLAEVIDFNLADKAGHPKFWR